MGLLPTSDDHYEKILVSSYAIFSPPLPWLCSPKDVVKLDVILTQQINRFYKANSKILPNSKTPESNRRPTVCTPQQNTFNSSPNDIPSADPRSQISICLLRKLSFRTELADRRKLWAREQRKPFNSKSQTMKTSEPTHPALRHSRVQVLRPFPIAS